MRRQLCQKALLHWVIFQATCFEILLQHQLPKNLRRSDVVLSEQNFTFYK